jgi:hypothetical protein
VPFLKDKNDVWPSTQEADRGWIVLDHWLWAVYSILQC